VVSATTATFWLNVFKPNTTLTVYYGTAAPGTCNISDPQPPNCMQPYPNFGFLQMLNANYASQSETTTDFLDQVALVQGIPNIYNATVTITGLTPNTKYHARSLTTDSLGNMAAYNDVVFITSPQDDLLTPSGAEPGSARPARDQAFTRPAGDQPCVDPSDFKAGQPVDSKLMTQMPAEMQSSLTANCVPR
jgi:hypothetical protein